jgi:hypothetical protein
MKLIETKTLGAGAASIEFTSIPQTFTDLVLKISSRSTGSASGINLRFNGDSSGVYDTRRLYGGGSSATSDNFVDQAAAYLGWQTQSTYTANTFSSIDVYIPNYTGSTNKSVSQDGVSENNATTAQQGIHAMLWRNTAAITSLFCSDGGSDFATGSTFSLYGITKGSDGIVTTS